MSTRDPREFTHASNAIRCRYTDFTFFNRSHTAAKVVSSSDGGRTWGHKLTVGAEQSAWPGLLTLDQTSFLALLDHGGAKAQRVTI